MKVATTALRLSLSVLTLAFGLQLTSGRVLDNFDDNTKTDWQDFLFPVGPYAQINEVNGQFHFNLIPVGQPIFAASTKTSETFDLTEGRTVEFRADLVTGNGHDSFAVLAFIPTTEQVSSLNGYGFAKSTTDILVTKSLDKYFYNEDPTTPIKNDNITMVLSLTVKNGDVIITTKALDKDANDAVIFERTFVDTPNVDVLSDGTDNGPAYMGSGRFVLICYEDEGDTQESYEVTFDNAEVIVTENTLLDDFNDNTKTAWEDFLFPVGPYAQINEVNGQFHFNLIPVGQSIFAASTKTSRTFDLVDGERVEFSVDLVTGNGPDSFAVLAFIPTTETVASLNGYGFAKSTTDILITKSLDKYFYNENPPTQIKNENITMVLSLTARGQSVTINAKVLDKDANNAVLFERTFVDTPSPDVLSDGTDNGPAYLGSGRFVLMCFEDEGDTQESYEVTFDNAWASAAPLPANTPPQIANISIANSANFVPASTPLTFTVADNADVPAENITLTLNGQVFTSGNGLTLSGSANNRTVTFSGLQTNITYTAIIDVDDAEEASSSATFTFDTFLPDNLMIEVEDYNFLGGQYIDNPVPIAEGTGPQSTGYANQFGIKNIDYSDTRNDFNSVPYRPDDNVRMQRTLDYPRAKYTQAGGSAAGVYDYDVGDIAAGEWLNYTRTFPSGTYEVYLRETLRNGTQVEAVLETVSNPTEENQSTRLLGSFIAPSSGLNFRNIPLTDAVGNKRTVTLTGQTTLRLRQVSSAPADGAIFQNYLIFIPTEDLSTHPSISALTPAAGSTTNTVTPRIEATILNSTAAVRIDSIKLFIDGAEVDPTVTSTVDGARLSYDLTPLPASGSSIDASIVFTDTEDFTQTNEWTFTITYNSLNADNRASGTGENRGFNVRVVQATTDVMPLENSLLRAEDQLASNSTIPKYLDTNVVLQVINMNQFEGDAGQIPGDTVVPGLEFGENGTDDFAVEIRAYLELTAGIHRFYVSTDDGFKLTFGTSTTDQSTTPIAFRNGAPSEQTFDVVVPAAGLYPMRLVWYERGGGAHAEFASVNRTTGDRTLINDPDAPNAIRAFTSLATPSIEVLVSTTLDGTPAPDASVIIDTNARRITVPSTGTQRFVLLRSLIPQRITSSTISENSVVFTYEPAN